MYKENYTQHAVEQIYELLGKNPQIRFNNNEQVYKSLGINSTFKRFPGDHNTVLNNPNDYKCVIDFIKKYSNKENSFKETHYLK